MFKTILSGSRVHEVSSAHLFKKSGKAMKFKEAAPKNGGVLGGWGEMRVVCGGGEVRFININKTLPIFSNLDCLSILAFFTFRF